MKAFYILIFLFAAFSLNAQKAEKVQVFDCILNLNKGASHLVTIIHSKTKTEAGKSPSATTLRYAARLLLQDSNAEERTFHWVFEIPDSTDTTPAIKAAGCKRSKGGLSPLPFTAMILLET